MSLSTIALWIAGGVTLAGLFAVAVRNWICIIGDDEPEDLTDEYPSVLPRIWGDED